MYSIFEHDVTKSIHLRIHPLADGVIEKLVHFLNPARGVVRDHDRDVAQRLALAAVAPEHAASKDLQFFRGLKGADHVGAVAAGGETDENVAGSADGFDLPREDRLVTEV